MQDAELFANSVLAIAADERLKNAFIQILSIGSYSQQTRVSSLRKAIAELAPPIEVLKFIDHLGNDKLAHEVLRRLREI